MDGGVVIMLKNWGYIFDEIFNGIISTIITLLIILIPLFIFIEILIKCNALEKLARKLSWFAKLIKVDKKAIFPLLVGIVMGVTYGAGTLIELNKEDPLSERDFAILGIFMYMCHGLIETVVIFAVAGANIWVVSIGRFLIALVVTMILARTSRIKKLSNEPKYIKT